jgi:glycerol-3-phosphate dehydrogenase
MATSRIGAGRSQRTEHPGGRLLVAGPAPDDLGRGGCRADPGASDRWSSSSAYLFYDCQTDDVRLVLTVLGEAERFGAVVLNRAEVTEVLDEEGQADGVAFREAESGARIELRADNVVNATGVWADRIRPEELLAEEEIPRIRPSRGTHVTLSTEQLDIGTAAASAGGRRADDLRPALVRAGAGRDHGQRLRGEHRPRAPSGDDVEYLLEAVNAISAPTSAPMT